MKKEMFGFGIFSLVLIILIGMFVIFSLNLTCAVDDVPVDVQKDVQDINNLAEQLPVNPETGEIDRGKIYSLVSKAEVRIQKINEWLNSNTGNFEIFLGMKPEISFIFFFNIILILSSIILLNNTAILFMKKYLTLISAFVVTFLIIQIGVILFISKMLGLWFSLLGNFSSNLILSQLIPSEIFQVLFLILFIFIIDFVTIKLGKKTKKMREEREKKKMKNKIEETKKSIKDIRKQPPQVIAENKEDFKSYAESLVKEINSMNQKIDQFNQKILELQGELNSLRKESGREIVNRGGSSGREIVNVGSPSVRGGRVESPKEKAINQELEKIKQVREKEQEELGKSKKSLEELEDILSVFNRFADEE